MTDQELDLSYKDTSNSFDELDYNEEEEKDESKKKEKYKKKRISTSEDGEVISSEDEIATPNYRHSWRSSGYKKVNDFRHQRQSETPPTTLQERSDENICRHYLQGRCSWGDECRFAHRTPDNHINRDTPPKRPHPQISHCLVPLLVEGRPHLIADPMTRPPHYPVHYYNHMTWLVHNEEAPPTTSRDKVEESQGWSRLRTITTNWMEDSDEEESSTTLRNNTNNNKRLKNNKSSDSENSDAEKKRKKMKNSSQDSLDKREKKKEEKRKRKKEREEEKKKEKEERKKEREEEERRKEREEEYAWTDPWARTKIKPKSESRKNDKTKMTRRQEEIKREIEEIDRQAKKERKQR